MIHPELLEVLCCPETRQRVREAPAPLLDRLNRAMQSGDLRAQNSVPITEALAGGLVREDGEFLYPIRNGIPIMLIEERIPVPPTEMVDPAGASDEDVEDQRHSGHHQVKTGAGT